MPELDEAAVRARVEAATDLWTWHEATDETIAGWGAHMGQMLYRLPDDGQTRDMKASILAMVADLPAALDENARLRAALDEARGEAADAHHEGFGAGVAFADAAGRLADFLESTWRARAEAAEKERDEARAEVARWRFMSAPVTLDQIEDEAAVNVELNERALAAESALAAVRALVPDECWVLRAPASGPVCTDMVGGGLPDGPKWTEDMCCLPCRIRAALAAPTTTDEGDPS